MRTHIQIRKYLFTLTVILGMFQSGEVFARELTQEELRIAGIYVHCPNNDEYACEGVRDIVQTVYTKVGYSDVAQKLLGQLEILTLLSATENGNPTAIFSSPDKGVINDLLWAAKDGKLAVTRQSTNSVSVFRVDPANLVGADGLYVRAFRDAELDELCTDY